MRGHYPAEVRSPRGFDRARALFAVGAVSVFAVLSAAALVVWDRSSPDAPRPLLDRSGEIERYVGIVLRDRFAGAEFRLARFEAGRAAGRPPRHDWRYEGWFSVRGSALRLPMTLPKEDDAIVARLESLRSLVGDVGGPSSFSRLVGEFEKASPQAEEFSPRAYREVFTGTVCSDRRHARLPRLVRNRYGEFDPRRVVFDEPAGAPGPIAVVVWDVEAGRWRYLGGPDATAVFENVVVHDRCSVGREEWYRARLRRDRTDVVEW
ncbi:MAG: hypothetical protein IBX62_07915 [Coriobacteriia bacterium]|nr:hypothetical protein [Coriobacteriia bacterium]